MAASVALLVACGSNDDGFIPDGGGTDATSKDTGTSKDGAPTQDSGKDGAQQGDSSGTCGTCPTGYACGTANGIAVCRSSTTNIPLFQHIFVILMENTSLATLQTGINGNKAPNLKKWTTSYATGTNYHGVSHPSLPNYVALTSGGVQGIGCDCGAKPGQGSCNPVLDFCFACSCDVKAQHIGDQLEAAQPPLTWMDFGESMGSACNLTDNGNYAVRHNPFLYYDNVQTPSSRCTSHVVDFSSFDPNSAANFNFIAPNLVSDMHNPSPPDATNIPAGDAWLGVHAGAILQSTNYTQGGLLVIVWDEDDASGGIGGTTDDPVGIWVMSPYAKTNYVSTTKADHYALLATFEDGLGVGRLGKASTATPLSDYFPAN